MICERCGKETRAVEVKCSNGKCERLCRECAGDGTVYAVTSGGHLVKLFVDKSRAYEYSRDLDDAYSVSPVHVDTTISKEIINAYYVVNYGDKWVAAETNQVSAPMHRPVRDGVLFTVCYAKNEEEAIGMAKERKWKSR